MSFFDEFTRAASEIAYSARRPKRGVTVVQPRDEIPLSESDLPESNAGLDNDHDFRKQLDDLCNLVALFVEPLPRFSPHAIPVDRVGRAIEDLRRILDHAKA